MIIHTMEQRTEEWLAVREGKLTATGLKDMMRSDNLPLIDKIIAERECGNIEPFYENFAMRRGNELEPKAKKALERKLDLKITEMGFVEPDDDSLKGFGLSPDGFIEEEIGMYPLGCEFKCPLPKTHVKYVRQGSLPNDYKHQVLAYFIVNENLKTMLFVSYCPEFLPKPLHIIEVQREDYEKEIEELKCNIVKFLAKLDKYYQQVTEVEF